MPGNSPCGTPLTSQANVEKPTTGHKETCIKYKEGHCSLANPMKLNIDSLDFVDAMDFLRLKADRKKGRLNRKITLSGPE